MDAVIGTIKFLTGPQAGNTYTINKPITNIGREPTNEIVISDPSVSRHHAQIMWNNGTWSIKKVAQQNTLTINQKAVQQSPISDNDTIGLGTGTTFLFQIANNQQDATRQAFVGQQQSFVGQQQSFVGQQRSLSGIPPTPPQQSFATSQAAPGISMGGTERAMAPSFSGLGSGQPMSIPTLEVSANIDHDKHIYQLAQPVIDIGRDPSNTIIINRPTISSFHAQIVREGNQLVFIHPNPKRGKTLNGIDYKGHTYRGEETFRKVLTRGDVFRISDENGTFVTLTYNDGTGASQDVIPEIRPIPLGMPVITIGRIPDNMVVLDHPQVSGHHARLEQVQSGYRIVDLNSTNHIYVNAQRVSTQMLKAGDEIRIGPFKLTYTGTQLTQHDESSSIRIDALNLVKQGNNRVILINDISLVIPPRKFVALVGGSGAGKSTLMDALNGLRPAQHGVVFYNGQDYYRHLAAFSTQLGYVPQDDIIHRDLTVKRALHYAARLRLPGDFTKQQIQQRIDEVLEDVDMKRQRDLLISKLSGGQRKRVSIALELLANPSVFFLDEPTSGLDPGLDRKMMLLMRKLADRGRTIVLVTHATNNINACDYVCFLARGGHLAYFGPPNDAKAYFGKTDFAEIYSALEPTDDNPQIPEQAESRFKQSPDYNLYVTQPMNEGPARAQRAQQPTATVKPPKRGNPWRQFFILAMRYMELLWNDKGNLAILLLQAPVIALLLVLLAAPTAFNPSGQNGIVSCPIRQDFQNNAGPIVSFDCQRVSDFLKTPAGQQFAAQHNMTPDQVLQSAIAFGGGDAQKVLFMMAFAAVFFGCINGSREIVKETAIYKRERTVNLGIIPYMFSKFVVLGVLCLLQSLIIVAAVNFKAPFQHNTFTFMSPFLEIYITTALTSLAGLMIGLAISAIVPNNDRAMSLVPLALLPQVLFAGVVFSLDSPPALQYLAAFFPARWAMAALGSTVGLHGDKLDADTFSYHGTLFSTISNTQAVNTEAMRHLLICWGALGLTILILAIAIGIFLKRKDVRA